MWKEANNMLMIDKVRELVNAKIKSISQGFVQQKSGVNREQSISPRLEKKRMFLFLVAKML